MVQNFLWRAVARIRVQRAEQILLASPFRKVEKGQREKKRSGPYSTTGFMRAGVYVTRKNRDEFINATVRVTVSFYFWGS